MGRKAYRNTKFEELYEELFFRYSPTELSKMLHVSRSTLNEWKNGKGFPDIGTLVEISNLLHVSVDYLLGLTEFNSLDGNMQSASQYTRLTEETIKALNDRYDGHGALILNGLVSNGYFDGFMIDVGKGINVATSLKINNDEPIFGDYKIAGVQLGMTKKDILKFQATEATRCIRIYLENVFLSLADDTKDLKDRIIAEMKEGI